jgi:hypothetical protein
VVIHIHIAGFSQDELHDRPQLLVGGRSHLLERWGGSSCLPPVRKQQVRLVCPAGEGRNQGAFWGLFHTFCTKVAADGAKTCRAG